MEVSGSLLYKSEKVYGPTRWVLLTITEPIYMVMRCKLQRVPGVGPDEGGWTRMNVGGEEKELYHMKYMK